MRKLTEKQAKLENEAQMEPSAKKNRSDNRITSIATLDNDTTVEVFKYLKYCGLAKTSLVSKRFSTLIHTHRLKLARMYVDNIGMNDYNSDPTDMKIFNKTLSPEQYNNWVICNQYSKKLPLETQISGIQSPQSERKVYQLYAYVDYYYRDSKPTTNSNSHNPTKVFDASAKLSHENWPVFQHFFRLLTDPFVYIRSIGLPFKNDALNLLSGAINPDYGRIQCHSLRVWYNMQNFISWIKDHVRCYNFDIMGPIHPNQPNNDEELLDLFMTGANCTSRIWLDFYEPCKLIARFVQKFMDLKGCDGNKVVGTIVCIPKMNVINMDVLERDYANFVVEENKNETSGVSYLVYEFVNNDIGKKLRLTITFYYRPASTEMDFKLKTSSL